MLLNIGIHDAGCGNFLFILQKNDSVADYQNRFNELWQKNSSVKSDKWLKKRLEKSLKE